MERKLDRGFTLIEVLVAAVILAVAVVPIVGVVGNGFSQVQRGRDVARASFLVRQAAEEAKVQDFDSLGPAVVPDYAASGMELRREIGQAGNMPQSLVKKVTVGVYRDGRLLASAVFLVYKKGY